MTRIAIEASRLSRLQGLAVPLTFDAGTYRRRPYLIMECLKGRALDDFVKRFRPNRAHRCRIVLQLCKILAEVHRQGILHLDLKPGNVMLCGAETVKIIDFGMSWDMSDRGLPHLFSHGTPGYMAPEQLDGNNSQWSPATDVYALGMLLKFLFANLVPKRSYDFRASGPRQPGLLEVRRLPRIPRASIQSVMQTATETDPQLRYPTVIEFQHALQRAI